MMEYFKHGKVEDLKNIETIENNGMNITNKKVNEFSIHLDIEATTAYNFACTM